MSDNVRGFEYDVALSFAGEDRDVAERLASQLRAQGVRVFYDKWEEAHLWGKNLYQHLSEVYGEAARFSVVLISARYAAKAWTSHELRSAQARALSEHAEYILPVRLDDTELPGVPSTIAYVDLRRVSVEHLVRLLLKKLDLETGAPIAEQRPHEERRAELEKGIRDLKHWDSEADRYQLSEVAKGVYAFTPKPGMERGEPQHMLCAHCASEKQKSILQLNSDTAARTVYLCHRCKNELHIWKPRNPNPINRTPGGPQGWMAR